MKIKFNYSERRIIAGFLYATRYSAKKRKTELEYLRNTGEISEKEFNAKIELNKRNKQRIDNLCNKFTDNALFVKIKKHDAEELRSIVQFAVDKCEEDTDSEKPAMTEQDYDICITALEKLDDGIARSE